MPFAQVKNGLPCQAETTFVLVLPVMCYCMIFDTVIGHFNDSGVDKSGMKYEFVIYFLPFEDALH